MLARRRERLVEQNSADLAGELAQQFLVKILEDALACCVCTLLFCDISEMR